MLKRRLIPSLLVRDGQIVQSVQFNHTNIIGNVITAVDFFNTWACDEILILDVGRTKSDRNTFLKIVDRLSERCFVPLSVGGWVSSLEDIEDLLEHGADKVVINTAAYRDSTFIIAASQRFGSQCIVVSIDVRKTPENSYEVYVDRGRVPTGLPPLDWARKVEALGAGEILCTSIDRDGMRQGYDNQLISAMTAAVSIPIIAFGGVGDWQHLVDGVVIGHADAVSAGNIFHFTEHSTKKAKEYMQASGVPVRDTVFFRVNLPRNPKYRQA